MNYPIFGAIVNQIETRLANREIQIDQFRLWNEEKINATGLEIGIKLGDKSEQIRRLVLNLDWDKFREARLARQLPGMEKHPLFKSSTYDKSIISPHLDVEILWYFDEQILYRKLDSSVGNRRIEAASHWMEHINKEIKKLLTEENLITRWHVEVEGDLMGRYVTNMSLISYMQFPIGDLAMLDTIHQFVEKNIQKILLRTDVIIGIAARTMEQSV